MRRRATQLLRATAVGAVVASVQVLALDNGLGRTPAMGLNTWNRFHCDISEDLVRGLADSLIDSGLHRLGYVYVNVDDCWQVARDADGYIIEDPVRFPSGMRALADYVHSLGLRFGTYSSAGTHTCEGRPASLDFERQDAESYARQGVDYLKLDNCHNAGLSDVAGTKLRYGRMRDALNATGRPVLFSLCNWGEANVWEYGAELGNSWRTTGDICDSFDGRDCSVMSLLDRQIDIVHHSGPGGFNDIDMLEVGNGGMTLEEYRTHFSAWAALKSPLLLGNDLRAMTPEIRDIIGNPEVIAINQDALGVSARLVERAGDADIWIGPLENGERVVLIINRHDRRTVPEITLHGEMFGAGRVRFEVRDLWQQSDLGIHRSKFLVGRIAPHSCVMLRITPADDRAEFDDIAFPPKGTFRPRGPRMSRQWRTIIGMLMVIVGCAAVLAADFILKRWWAPTEHGPIYLPLSQE